MNSKTITEKEREILRQQLGREPEGAQEILVKESVWRTSSRACFTSCEWKAVWKFLLVELPQVKRGRCSSRGKWVDSKDPVGNFGN